MATTLLTFDQAKELTSPYHELWSDAFRGAEKFYWGTLREDHPDEFAAMDARARANMLNRLAVKRIERDVELDNETYRFPVQAIQSNGLSALVRFKLLDQEMRPQNHSSDQQTNIANHVFTTEQLEFYGMPEPPTWLVAGYQLNAARDGMSSLLVVSHHGDQHRFDYDLENPEAGTSVVTLPIRDLPPALPRIASKIRRAEQDDASDGEE